MLWCSCTAKVGVCLLAVEPAFDANVGLVLCLETCCVNSDCGA
jgi:hypothetical protein